MATIKKIVTSSKGTVLADIGGGLFVARNGSMSLAVCRLVPEGYKVVKTLDSGKMMRTQQDFMDCVRFIAPDEVAFLADPVAEAAGFVEESRKAFEDVKKRSLELIDAFLTRHDVDCVYAIDLDGCNSPLVISNDENPDLSFTFDRILRRRGEPLSFEVQASNCCDTVSVNAETLDAERVLDILEYLVKNEDHLERNGE